jgi:hypothetical protein
MPINENAVPVDSTGLPQCTPDHRQAVNDAFMRGYTVLVRRRNARSPEAWEIATNLDLPDTIAEYFVPDQQQAERMLQALNAPAVPPAAPPAALSEAALAAHGFAWNPSMRVYCGVLGPWRAQLYQRASTWYLEVEGPEPFLSSNARVARTIADAGDLAQTVAVLSAFAAPARTGSIPRGGN